MESAYWPMRHCCVTATPSPERRKRRRLGEKRIDEVAAESCPSAVQSGCQGKGRASAKEEIPVTANVARRA
jgi:hypothetical protein